jgi:hypothetical protein
MKVTGMQTGFKEYIYQAFNARPLGMPIPPNWIGLGVFGLLGLVSPGFWILGTGLELGYLFFLSTHPRFQRIIKARIQSQTHHQRYVKLMELLGQLEPQEQKQYKSLEDRCRNILDQLSTSETAVAVSAQSEGLSRLLWIFLRLLLTRQAIMRALREAQAKGSDSLEERIAGLEEKLKNTSMSEDLRKSLMSQMEILRQRQDKHREAGEKMAFLDAELMRIQEQVELLREQAVLSTGPEVISQRIDQISENLGDTTQWIQEQQKIYGCVEDLLAEPPPLTSAPRERESQ